jgi:hypothetical protein
LIQRRPSPAVEVMSVTTGRPVDAVCRPALSSDQSTELFAGIWFAEPRKVRRTRNPATYRS